MNWFGFGRFVELLTGSRPWLALVLVSSIIGATFETAGIASVLPFLGILMDPAAVTRYRWLDGAIDFFGLAPDQVVFAAGAMTIAVLALGNAAAIGNIWVQQKFIGHLRQSLAMELFEGYMRLPYQFHVQRDASSLTKVIFYDVETAIGSFVSPFLVVISRGLVAVVLLAFLVMLDPMVAVGVAGCLGGSYFLLYRALRGRQKKLGELVNDAALVRGRTAIEGIGGIKELRVLGREREYLQRFARAMRVLADAQVSYNLVAQIPRYGLEALAFGGIVIAALVLVRARDPQAALPILALYAFAGYRLMPAFQQIYSAVIAIGFSSAAVSAVKHDLDIVRGFAASKGHGLSHMPFTREIQFEKVTFTYAGAPRPVLKDVSLSIGRNQSIGLVGRTGAGKTTLADLLLGLYLPTSGAIRVDGIPLDADNVASWQRRVGYVPQHVFLANATIAENIAFGLSADEIDMRAVEQAARMAQADEFIQSLPSTYDSVIGERGVRLSGGQRQRIGIARALYHDPDVLVFDEATSALDGLTEDAVISAVRSLSVERTVILIAHRLRTVEACDRIIMLQDGQVVADGAYGQLLQQSAAFRLLVNAHAAA